MSRSKPSESRLTGDSVSHSTSMRYWQDVRRHCSLCALCDNTGHTACHTSPSVLFSRLRSSTRYRMPPWRGGGTRVLLTNDHDRLEAFLRRAVSFGYRDSSAPSLARICEQADDKLFSNILRNDKHLLRPLLPPESCQQYSLRRRRYNLQLPFAPQ
jgi:hypothetical protein